MKTNIRGVGVALVTPFTDEDGIDFAALDKLIERVIGGGADYLVALGTTAETPALSGSEKEAILRFVVERSAGRVPVIAGLGGNSTADVVSALRSANLDGVDAVLSVTPYYNKPSQEGIYRHYKALAEASPCGIVLYNVPGQVHARGKVKKRRKSSQHQTDQDLKSEDHPPAPPFCTRMSSAVSMGYRRSAVPSSGSRCRSTAVMRRLP